MGNYLQWTPPRNKDHITTINRVFAENLVALGFLHVCFLRKTDPNPRKTILAAGKSGPKCHFFNLFFLGVGLALGWGVRRFHNNIYMFPNPTEIGIPGIASTLML